MLVLKVRLSSTSPFVLKSNVLLTLTLEHALPLTYRRYLDTLRPYNPNTLGRRIGRLGIQLAFYPPLFSFFFIARVVAAKDGTYPGWLLAFQGGIFTVMWAAHDWLLKPFIGNGEMSYEEAGTDAVGVEGKKEA